MPEAYKVDRLGGAIMYDSPIKITTTEQAVTELAGNVENEIYVRVKAAVNIDIDKDELIKALQYDRDQYNAGFRDGYAAGVAEAHQGGYDQ
jgi:flagellar biosynthesis/type III secretory pathway protein FliH